MFGDPSWKDIKFSAEVKQEDGSSADLIFRAAGRRSYTYFEPGGWGNAWHDIQHTTSSDGRGESWRRVAIARASDPVDPKTWHSIEVEIKGDSVICRRAGKVVLQGKGLGEPSGLVGLRTWGTLARFRNVRVVDGDGKTLLEGVPRLAELHP
jgi:hypothetical protein